MQPAEIRLDTADLNTIETLVTELSHPEPRRVIYAVDLLESLDKRHLVTPLLLHHESPEVRARALQVAAAAGPARGRGQWLRGVERSLKDSDGEVRLAAVRALAALNAARTPPSVMRGFLARPRPALVVTAASRSPRARPRAIAPRPRDALQRARRRHARAGSARSASEVARALGQVRNPQIPAAARAADVRRRSRRRARSDPQRRPIGPGGRRLPVRAAAGLADAEPPVEARRAREVLVGYGDDVVEALAYFLADPDEDIWVRRHVPSTLGLIPDAAVDGRAGLGARSRRWFRPLQGGRRHRAARAATAPALTIDRAVIERQILQETTRAFSALTLHHNLFVDGGLDGAIAARARAERKERSAPSIESSVCSA